MSKLALAIDRFVEERPSCSLEGQRGVDTLTAIVEKLGYNGRFEPSIDAFLKDNSGAIEAIIEWIGKQRVPDWVEAFNDSQPQEEDEG